MKALSVQRLAVAGLTACLLILPRLSFAQSVPSPNGVYVPAANTLGFSTNSTEWMRITSTGNVGIGTTSPTAGTALDLGSNTTSSNSSLLLPVGTTGTRPTGVNGMIRYNSTTPAVEVYVGGAWTSLGGAGSSGTVNTGTQYQNAYYAATGTAVSGDPTIRTDSGHDFILTIGNLAIGTTTVTNAINLNGSAAQTVSMVRSASTSGSTLTVQAGGGESGGTNLNGGTLVLQSGISTGTGSSGISFNLYPAGSSGTSDDVSLNALNINATGVTGTNAVTYLGVNSGTGTNQNGGNLVLSSGISTGTGTSSMSFRVYGAGSSGSTANNPTTAMTLTTTGGTTQQGVVAIGTTVPNNYAMLSLSYSAANNNGIDIDNTYTGGHDWNIGDGVGVSCSSGNFCFDDYTSNAERLVINSSGYVGIGTTSPGAKLDVYISSGVGAIDLGGVNGISYPSADSVTAGTIAIGSGALAAIGTSNQATNSVAVGYQALNVATTVGAATPPQSVAVGFQSLLKMTSGVNNNGVGWKSLLNVTTGDYNDAIGHDAGGGITTGNGNVALGEGALFDNGSTSASIGADTCVGTTCLYNESNQYNTCIGYSCLYNAGNTQGNTSVGYQAGAAVTSGSYNVVIGVNSGNTTLQSGSNNILIGQGVDTLTSSTSNSLNIGNLIYATSLGSYTTASTGSVGIGTTSPQATLDVAGYTRLTPYSSQPVACSSANNGAIALTAVYTLCVCKGSTTAWYLASNGTTACTW